MLACLAIGLIICSVFAAVKVGALSMPEPTKAIAAGLPPLVGSRRADAAWTSAACASLYPLMFYRGGLCSARRWQSKLIGVHPIS